MPRDGSGTYTLPAGNPVSPGSVISSTWANDTMDDLALSMTDSLDRNGRGGMLAPFSFTDGTESSPGANWSNEPTTGFYRAGSGDLRVTLLNQDIMRWNGTDIFRWNEPTMMWDALLYAGGPGSVPNGTVEGQTLVWDEATDQQWKASSQLIVDAAGDTTVASGFIVALAGNLRAEQTDTQAQIQLRRNSASAMVSGNIIGRIAAQGFDGTGNAASGRIDVVADGTWAVGDVPSRMEFYTAPVGGVQVKRMTIDSAGLVNMGDTDNLSGFRLFVGVAAGTSHIQVFAGAGAASLYLTPADGTSHGQILFGPVGDFSNGKIVFQNNVTQMQFFTGATQRMVIDDAGRMGINEVAPDHLVHIKRTLNTEFGMFIQQDADVALAWTPGSADIMAIHRGTATARLHIIGGNTSFSILEFSDQDARGSGQVNYSHADDTMRFFTSGSEGMRINSVGNVGIGTLDPQGELHIKGSTPEVILQPTGDVQGSRIDFINLAGTVNGRIQFDNTAQDMTFSTRAGGGTFNAKLTILSASGDVEINEGDLNVLLGNVNIGSRAFVANGNAAAPSFAFTNSTGSGFYRFSADRIGIAIGGLSKGLIDATSIEGQWRFRGHNGAASSPTHSFQNDDDNGMFLAGTDVIGWSTNGTEKMRLVEAGSLLVGKTSAAVAETFGVSSVGAACIMMQAESAGAVRLHAATQTVNRATDYIEFNGTAWRFVVNGVEVGTFP